LKTVPNRLAGWGIGDITQADSTLKKLYLRYTPNPLLGGFLLSMYF